MYPSTKSSVVPPSPFNTGVYIELLVAIVPDEVILPVTFKSSLTPTGLFPGAVNVCAYIVPLALILPEAVISFVTRRFIKLPNSAFIFLEAVISPVVLVIDEDFNCLTSNLVNSVSSSF